MNDPGKVVNVLNQVIVFGARSRDAGSVGLLKCIVANQVRRHLAGDADQRDAIHQRIGQAGHRIGGAGAGRHQDHPDLAGGAGVSFGGVDGAALGATVGAALGATLGAALGTLLGVALGDALG